MEPVMSASDDVSAQARRTGFCAHPIRLRGRTDLVDAATGEMRSLVDSSSQPGGSLLIPCRNRRATLCPACAETYRGDAWQLIAAGLRGGKGVDAVVAEHPRAFVTLTAPSFGDVHSRRVSNGPPRRCRSRRSGKCAHGRARSCRLVHGEDDALLGQALCPECFAYEEAVLWNALAGQLWSRTVTNIRRGVARVIGVSASRLAAYATVSFVKVVEYQARGVVHLHAVVRLDPAECAPVPSQSPLGADTLTEVIRESAATTWVPCMLPDGVQKRLGWGRQVDVRAIAQDGPDSAVVAAYIAKYATKSTDANGGLDRPIRRPGQIDRLRVNPHLRRLVHTCWALGGDTRYRDLRLRAWAHTLGYRGHWTTKSRRYSTTFTALRAARARHVSGEDPDLLRISQWRYVGRGYELRGA